MSLDRAQIKLYLYNHTRAYKGASENEIKYQVIKQFLIANNREFGSNNQAEVVLNDGSLYHQILSVVDQKMENDAYDNYSDFEYAMVKRILLYVPNGRSNDDLDRKQFVITTTFTNRIKSINPKLGSLFQTLFDTMNKNAYRGMGIILMLIVLASLISVFNYYRANITGGNVYTVVKSTARGAYSVSRYIITSTIIDEKYLLPIEYIANGIIVTVETGVINVSYLLEQLELFREQLILLLTNNPIVPAVTYLLESRIGETVPEQALHQMVEHAPTETVQRLLYWLTSNGFGTINLS